MNIQNITIMLTLVIYDIFVVQLILINHEFLYKFEHHHHDDIFGGIAIFLKKRKNLKLMHNFIPFFI